MNNKHRMTIEKRTRDLAVRRDPKIIRERHHQLSIANTLALSATAGSAILAVSAAALELPLIMGLAAALAGVGAFAAVKKLRFLSLYEDSSRDRRSGADRRKESEAQLAEAR
jgi:hypothetical protein